MKKITFILFALIAGTTFAQTASETAEVFAEIISPIGITKGGTNLNFGKLAAPTADTQVLVSTAGDRTAANGVTIPGGSISAASFNITAAEGFAYSITIPDTNLTGPSGSTAMKVEYSSSLGATNTGIAAGTQTLNVGGELFINATQAPGSYSGTVEVTVQYQ